MIVNATIQIKAAMTTLFAAAFSSKPNDSLPGGNVLDKLIGGVMTWGTYAVVGALVVGGVMLGWGQHSHNPQHAGKGKLLILGAIVGAIVIGGANGIGESFFKLGAEVK